VSRPSARGGRAPALVLALLASSAAQAAPGLQLYPVRGVFFPVDDTPGRVDADFRAAISAGEQPYFAAKFRERFPEAATTITEGTQRRTFAVSLQIARASRYTVKKANGTVDVYLPVTASLYFTNVMTGEVLYAATRTTIKTVTLMPAQARAGGEKTVALFADTFHDVVDDLVSDAKERFKPHTVSAKVVKVWSGLAVLGAGTDEGLARDDTLTDDKGDELKVLHAGPGYAVATAVLGAFERGASFSRVSNGTLAEIRRPRLLPLVEAAPAGFPEESLVQLFSDALGASAPVSLVPVNRTFAAVVRALSAQLDLSKEKLTQRELPGFFVRLHVPEPISYERATNLDYQTLRVTEALAYAEVVDRAGRVLYAAFGRDRTEDTITQGQALGLEARKEIAVKNALLALAKRFGAEFRLETARLELAEGGQHLAVKDEHGVLAAGASLRAYRSLGKVEGVTGEVLAPTWELEVAVPGEEVTELGAVLPVVNDAPAPQKGDVLIVEGASGVDARRKRFGPCGEAEQLGPVELPGYTALAFNLFAAGFRAPFYARGLGARVEALVHGGTGFKEALAFAEPKVDYCVQPAYRITAVEPTCSESACAEVATIKLGYRARLATADGAVKATAGQETKMTAAALPRATSAEVRARALQGDLFDEVLKLAPAAAARLAKEKL
jgi:hypothetical protein